MPIKLRDYQQNVVDRVYNSWQNGNRNVALVMGTGLGKSICLSSIALDFKNQHRNVAVIAHRNELVSQMSCHLARAGIVHRVIASKTTVGQITRKHRALFGKSFISPTELTAVVGVDTLISRYESLKAWAQQISLWEIDEYHHCTVNNKWGKAVQLFQNAYGLGVTATPNRADGQGLGRHADGYTDDMVIGPSMRWSIEHGFLADYEIVCPKSDLKVDDSEVSANGDWSNQTLRKAAKKSKIVGDVVQNYIKYAHGRQAIVFATDVETADEISKDFNEHGIKAVSLNGNSQAAYREQSLELFAKSEIQVLVNVDLFDEGLDISGCDVVIMARPTASLGKYLQQCLDDKTEILTKRGWLSRKEILDDDIIAGFNIENEKIEWCEILEKIERPIGENEKMYSFSNQHLDFRVTGGHNMIVKGHSNSCINWIKQTCEYVYNRSSMFYVPVAGICNDKDNSSITDDEIRFLGWFLTDGTKNKYTNQIIISQSMKHEEYRKNIENVLNKCGFKYGVYIVKRTGKWKKFEPDVRYSISYGKPKGTKKHLRGWKDLEPWIDRDISEIYNTLSHRQLKILLETMNLGDGSKRKNLDYNEQSICLCTGDHILKTDRLQSLCVRKGFRCNKSFQQREKNKTYYLHIKDVKTSSIAGKNVKNGKIINKTYKRKRIEESFVKKDEIVWCVRNKLGTLITRRNGKVVIMGNCGRALRPAPGKTALIIDHVSNVIRHGLPDMPREWSLDRRQKKAKQVKDPDEIELTVCKNCLKPYEKFRTVCPYCGAEPALPEPRSRSIEMVEGDLILLDRAALERMRRGTMLEAPGSVAERVARVAGPIAAKGVANRQIEKIAAQGELKDAIAQWAAIERSKGFNDREIYKRFYLSTGMDVLTALDGSRSRQDYLTTAERVRGWYKCVNQQ